MKTCKHIAVAAGLVMLASSAGAPAIAADSSSACSVSQVEIDPASVVEPCSKLADDPGTTPAQRGFALYIRGRGYHNTKRLQLAKTDYDAALKLTPENGELLVSRANIAFRFGQPREGLEFIQRALEIDPSNGHALRTVGALNQDAGAFDEAIRYFTKALEADPQDAYALLFRCDTYTRTRRYAEALKDADALVAIAPDAINRQGYLDGDGNRLDFHIIALEKRAELYEALGQSDKAEQDLAAAVSYKPSAASLAARGKYLAYKRGREQEALVDLQKAAELGSDDSRAFYAEGMAYLHFRQPEKALDAFDKAVKLDPEFAYALRMRGRMHRELGQTDLALADMKNAILVGGSVLRETMPALRNAGYWRSGQDPTAMTPEFEDALRACMIDKHCN
ncbi:MAG TPA: tetratricopeptide repeat protein [Xanthobacteraceae bacterium]